MKDKKSIIRSVRMTPTVHDYVQKMEGKSFNDKFNRMIIFCMTREKMAHEQVKELEKKQADLKNQIMEEEQFLKYLDEIRRISEEMFHHIKGV